MINVWDSEQFRKCDYAVHWGQICFCVSKFAHETEDTIVQRFVCALHVHQPTIKNMTG